METKARITLQATEWSGWDPEGYNITTSAQLWVRKEQVLTPETLGKRKADYTDIDFLFYEIVVERIVADRVGFAFRKLVIKNPDGTINLTLPNFGSFILQLEERKDLATPTMDGGTLVTVILDEIQ